MSVNKKLLECIPKRPTDSIDWDHIESSPLGGIIQKMKNTPQNPVWHGEGDVWSHTKMVCTEMIGLADFWAYEERIRQELFLAALLHDIGKVPCTRQEDGVWVSPNHTSVGARMAREILWIDFGVCGLPELQAFRETICTLIRYHSVPMHIFDRPDLERQLLRIASNGELSVDFTLKMLGILAKADAKGRIAKDKQESVDLAELFSAEAERLGCLYSPYKFADSFSQYEYLNGKNILPEQQLYNDTWGEVILLSGLPGTGKDTWIKNFYPDMPVISLDEIRRELKIGPTKPQGAVVNAAKERAKEYLRKKIPFIWNATNLTPMIREMQIKLFRSYNAGVRIVFLETEWNEEMRRNKNRENPVPEERIRHMMRDMVLPERFEGHSVCRYCV